MTDIEDDTSNETINHHKDLGDPSLITYYVPWILYFYPNPKSDPNYVLLDIKNDKKSVENAKTTVIWIISLSVMIYLIYTVYINGVFKPALYTTGFFIFRIITLLFVFFMFSVIIYLIGIFGWFYRTYLIIFEWFKDPLNYNSTTRSFRRKNKYLKWFMSFIIYLLAIVSFVGLSLLLFICLVLMALLSVLIGFFMKNVGGVLGMAEDRNKESSNLDSLPGTFINKVPSMTNMSSTSKLFLPTMSTLPKIPSLPGK